VITLFIFYLHTIAAVTIFTVRWQESGWKEGLLGVGFLLLIFSVGWSIATVIVNFFVDHQGFGPLLDKDTLALVLLTMMEAVFFIAQSKRRKLRMRRAA
jgi:hypothetical protein